MQSVSDVIVHDAMRDSLALHWVQFRHSFIKVYGFWNKNILLPWHTCDTTTARLEFSLLFTFSRLKLLLPVNSVIVNVARIGVESSGDKDRDVDPIKTSLLLENNNVLLEEGLAISKIAS